MRIALRSRPGRFGLIITALILSIAGIGLATPHIKASSSHNKKEDAFVLENGKIYTFDKHNSVVSAVRIEDNKIVEIGKRVDKKDARVINLKGRTVIPGMVENHVHFVRMGNLVGYDTRELETAFKVSDAQKIIKDKAKKVPSGEFITAMGGMARRQFAEGRFPNLQELDAATSKHPVLLAEGGSGPSQANTKARDILRGLGVAVADDGTIASGTESSRAYSVLATSLTDEHRKRQLQDEAKYAFSVGLTTVMDQHGSTPGAGFLDRATGHDAYLELTRKQDDEGKVLLPRTRFFFPAMNQAELTELLNNRWLNFGNDMAKVSGVGEWAPRDDTYLQSLTAIAQRGAMYHQHLISTQEIEAQLNIIEQVNQQIPVANLHWSLDHISGITPEQIERANKLGIGLAAHSWNYLTSNNGGPAFRTLLDKATVPVGAGLDGARVAPLNPWTGVYYMTTGKNSGGALVNDGQQITREEAVKLYAGPQQGWFSGEENTLGGIGVGRYADLVVLDRNVFDKRQVPDGELRNTKSIMTIVNGRIVHEAGKLN